MTPLRLGDGIAHYNEQPGGTNRLKRCAPHFLFYFLLFYLFTLSLVLFTLLPFYFFTFFPFLLWFWKLTGPLSHD